MAYFGDSDLLGNGLLPSTNYGVEDDVGEIQEDGLYEAKREAVYSHPDQTKNEVGLLSLNFQNFIDDETQINGLIYSRYGRQKRLGGDVEANLKQPRMNGSLKVSLTIPKLVKMVADLA